MKAMYNGILFDSLNELKYALSIEDEYCYLYHPFKIYDTFMYHGRKVIENNTPSYTPDFLIRHSKSNEAFLVEVKGNSEKDQEKRSRIAKEFIKNHGRDYSFQWVKMSQKDLSLKKEKRFHEVCSNQKELIRFYRFLSDWYKRGVPYYNPFMMDSTDYEIFVREGIR